VDKRLLKLLLLHPPLLLLLHLPPLLLLHLPLLLLLPLLPQPRLLTQRRSNPTVFKQ
jgi:hypothetical protein